MSTDHRDSERPSARQSEAPDTSDVRRAKDELFEAIDHFRSAASILFERATKDTTLRQATAEAERVVQKIGATAEPLAKQLATELAKLTRTIVESVDSKRKSEVPPPPTDKD
ncbi:MAG: hypothetical protein IPK60_00790 [Sandaracinaceae bacterium]|nr:hypothetical protein [Sandaracinaceae bacterium]